MINENLPLLDNLAKEQATYVLTKKPKNVEDNKRESMVVVILIVGLSSTVFVLLTIIGVCLIRGSPGIRSKSPKSCSSPNSFSQGRLMGFYIW